jgi:hypothetical protein
MRSLLKNLINVFCKKITKMKLKTMKLIKANIKILKGINYIQYFRNDGSYLVEKYNENS